MGSSTSGRGLEGVIDALSLELPLDRFYNDLNDNSDDLKSFYDECKSLYSNKTYFKYKRLCSVLLRFLKNSRTRKENANSAYDDCIPFNYWMYGELYKKYIKKDPYKLVPAFGEIQEIWNSLIENEKLSDYFGKCKPDFDIPTQDDWRQRKQLYDYCVNYESLKKQSEFYKNNCRQIYAYIKSSAPLYKHFKTSCASNDEKKCPKFYDKCKDYDPDIVLRDLPCYKSIHKEETTATEKVLSVESHPELPADGTFSSDDSYLQRENTPPVTKAGKVLLGVVATTMTSGALYKFTPLGNMLRNRFGWSNNMRNFNGGDNGLFDYASESFNPFSGGAEEHYIGYHPA